MNNRNLEYDQQLEAPSPDAFERSALRFVRAIMDATPNGECILVQYHPNGDWFVASEPHKSLEMAARERYARSVRPGRNGKMSKPNLAFIAAILKGEHDDYPGCRAALAEEFLERQK